MPSGSINNAGASISSALTHSQSRITTSDASSSRRAESRVSPPHSNRQYSNNNKLGHSSKKSVPTIQLAPPKDAENVSLLRRLVSVRSIAALMCFLLLVITVTIVLVVTSQFSLSASRDIASQHALSISSKAKSDVEDFLNIPLRYCVGWQYAMSKEYHGLPSDDPDWFVPWNQMLLQPMASTNFSFQYSVMGFNDGTALVWLPVANERVRLQLYNYSGRNGDPTQLSNLTNTDYYRSNYSVATVAHSQTTYDPRSRSWFVQATQTRGGMRWSNVWLSTVPTLPIINVAAAIYNDSNTFLGIATLNYDLSTLGSFIGNLKTTANTNSFLIDNDGLLVASSLASEHPLMVNTPISANYSGAVGSNCIRSDVSNGAAQNIIACRQLASTYGFQPLRNLYVTDPALLATGQSSSTIVRKSGGQQYFIAVVPIETSMATNMAWRFALFLPEDDIIGEVIKGRNVAIYICIGVVALAVIVSLVVITLLLRPLDAIADRMYRVAMMQDVGDSDEDGDMEEEGSQKTVSRPEQRSALYEVATIRTAFQTMTAELAKIKSFLPQSVLAQLYGSISDEGDLLPSPSGLRSPSTTSALRHNESQSTRSGSARLGNSTMQTSTNQNSSNPSTTHIVTANGLNTSVKLTSRKVTMLCLNVLGFHRHIQRRSNDDLVRQHAMIVKCVSDACSDHRGVMDGFQGDRFMVSFNAVTSAGNHAVFAAHTARAVSEAVISKSQLKISSGLASGAALVGNMGSSATKRFTVLSHVVTSAVLLERLSKKYCPRNPFRWSQGPHCKKSSLCSTPSRWMPSYCPRLEGVSNELAYVA